MIRLVKYIELQYEDVLHGQKGKVKNVTDKGGKILSTEEVSEGQRGKDLVLTIDMNLQLEIEKIIEEELWNAKQNSKSALLDRAFVVLMNPHTGEILTMAGKQIAKNDETNKQEMRDFALGI
jgi:cell division protein FtsI/penicillin-binding protein 2